MSCLNKYSVFCVTESNFVNVWTQRRPTTCPNDTRHEIDSNRIMIIDKQVIEEYPQHVYIASKSFQNTKGYYMYEGIHYHINQGTSNFIQDTTLPISQCIYGLKVNINQEHIGDKFNIVINPETIVGVLTQPANIGDTVIHVSSTVTQNVVPGFYLIIGDEEHMVVSTNEEINTITLKEPLVSNHSVFEQIKLMVYIVRNYFVECTGIIDIGYGTLGGKPLDAGSVIRLMYQNMNSSVDKCFCINYEYTY